MLPSTTERVPTHTDEKVNEQIREQTEENIVRFVDADRQAVEQRLDELDREWDIERALEANAATAVLVGVILGAAVDKRFFYFPGVVAGFLLQHALQGWCPPVPILRRMGFRTQSEIDREKYALKALRGDFEHLPTQPNVFQRDAVSEAVAAVER